MEGEEGINAASFAAAGGTNHNPSSPPQDDRGSDPADEVAELEIHSPVSDEDHDHEQEEDHAAGTVISADDLKLKIIKQARLLYL